MKALITGSEGFVGKYLRAELEAHGYDVTGLDLVPGEKTVAVNLLEPEKHLEPEKLRERYPEFRTYEGKCRFRECLHDREPGCAVQEAADRGDIGFGRLQRYRQLLQETREGWRDRYD